MPPVKSELLTLGDIAAKLCARDHVVRDAINSLAIEPAAKAGQYRLFNAVQVESIRREVARRAERKAAAHV